MQSMGDEIKEILDEKHIHYLYHFTKAINLKSILIHGIVPRSELRKLFKDPKKYNVCINDKQRLDGCLNATSVSIGFPNYKLFYDLRNREENFYREWVVLSINAQILCKLPCAFCWKNASDKQMSEQLKIKEKREEMGSPEALRDMFEDHKGEPKRYPGYRSNFPTNPQAEVLIFGKIPVKDIECIYFEDKATMEQYKSDFSSRKPAKCGPFFFKNRSDSFKW